MRVCLLFLLLLPCTFLLDTAAIKITSGIKAYDISKTLQFVWDSLMRWYKERVPDRGPPGETNAFVFHLYIIRIDMNINNDHLV